MSNMLNVAVATYETEFDMKLKANATAKNLFDTIVATTGIRELWYFGLQFTDQQNQPDWLLMEKKIKVQNVKNDPKKKFQFKFKFFPENVADEVIQDVTLRLLFKQVKQDILSENLYCPAEKAVLLASFAVQAKFGDHDQVESGYLANEKILPPKILSQHKLSMEEWEEKVSQFHKQHRGMNADEASLEYLKLAQDLEAFGITYFQVQNQKGTDALLGVDALGINFYDMKDKFNPKVSFPWSEIAKVAYTKDKFKIKFTDPKTPAHKVKCKQPKTSKKIFLLATGNHDMYNRRRKPDTLEVQQMKAQREGDRKAREKERARLRREQEAREKSEAAQAEMAAKLKALEEDMLQRQRELTEARETIERLERQLQETQAAREALESQQTELRELLEKLEQDHELEVEGRQKLEEEIRAKETEIEEIRQRVEEKEELSQQLREEMEEAKLKLERSEQAVQEGSINMTMTANRENAAALVGRGRDSGSDSDDERQSTILPRARRDSSASSGASSDDNGDRQHAESLPGVDQMPRIVVDDSEEDRRPDERTQDLLQSLRSDLSQTQTSETAEDRQYKDNVSQGRDKFKTLRDVRRGNTLRRIDMFENM